MIRGVEDLAYIREDGTIIMPSGPCSAWPMGRNVVAHDFREKYISVSQGGHRRQATEVKASAGQMIAGFAKTAAGAVVHGRTSQMERDTRYQMCQHCPEYIKNSDRCAQCGCFMPAKTWIKAAKCPVGKW